MDNNTMDILARDANYIGRTGNDNADDMDDFGLGKDDLIRPDLQALTVQSFLKEVKLTPKEYEKKFSN